MIDEPMKHNSIVSLVKRILKISACNDKIILKDSVGDVLLVHLYVCQQKNHLHPRGSIAPISVTLCLGRYLFSLSLHAYLSSPIT